MKVSEIKEYLGGVNAPPKVVESLRCLADEVQSIGDDLRVASMVIKSHDVCITTHSTALEHLKQQIKNLSESAKEKTEPQPEPVGEGYRLLGGSEVIRDGDECYGEVSAGGTKEWHAMSKACNGDRAMGYGRVRRSIVAPTPEKAVKPREWWICPGKAIGNIFDSPCAGRLDDAIHVREVAPITFEEAVLVIRKHLDPETLAAMAQRVSDTKRVEWPGPLFSDAIYVLKTAFGIK